MKWKITAPASHPNICSGFFDPFYRVPGNDATGSGLGLTIVRNIAARYGGQITLGPAVTGGLLFRFTQPT